MRESTNKCDKQAPLESKKSILAWRYCSIWSAISAWVGTMEVHSACLNERLPGRAKQPVANQDKKSKKKIKGKSKGSKNQRKRIKGVR